MKTRYLLEGCGAAILILLAYIWPQISPSHVAIYLSVLPMTSVTLGILIDLTVLSLVCSILFAVASRGDQRNTRAVWAIVVAVVVIATVQSVAKITETHRFVPKPGILLAALLGILLIARYGKPSNYQGAIVGFRFALRMVGFSILWMAPQ